MKRETKLMHNVFDVNAEIRLFKRTKQNKITITTIKIKKIRLKQTTNYTHTENMKRKVEEKKPKN